MNHPSLAKIDAGVWKRVVDGDVKSFETVVDRYQSAVCAVAFNIIGDFSVSQDIAQDTFWAAWAAKEKLEQSSKLRQWLCGIARNLARQWNRNKLRRSEVNVDSIPPIQDRAAEPVAQFISEEENALVWKALEKIPPNYRDVIRLFYINNKSTEQIANRLNISNDAARQRLHRGREMLKTHISQLVDGVLDRRNPSRSFTSRVMAGIVGAGVAGKSSSLMASTGIYTSVATASALKLLAGGAGLGLVGGLLGTAGGLLGAWLGTWLPSQAAPTETERQFLLERGRPIMRLSVGFSLTILLLALALVFKLLNPWFFFAALGGLSSAFTGYVVLQSLRTQSMVNQLRQEIAPWEDPNQSPWAKYTQMGIRPGHPVYRGRRYTSGLRLLGLPLIDIQVGDPPSWQQAAGSQAKGQQVTWDHRTARGWIAIGDVAYGGLLAIGGRAIGTMALGGVAIGGLAVGGISVGGLTLGGMAVGALAIGGLGIGWTAIAGGAVAWYSATGGVGIAYHYAAGGLAIAHDFAAGGNAVANEANTQLAWSVVEQNTFVQLLKNQWITWAFVLVMVVFSSSMHGLMYERQARPPHEVFDFDGNDRV